jgi:outer membrane protein assembly factor BamD
MKRERGKKRRWGTAAAYRGAILLCCLALAGCAGGMPSIPNSPDAVLAKGEQQFKNGKYYQSRELFKAFMERHAGHDRSDYAQFMLAESYFNEGEYALAAVEYRILATNYGYSEYAEESFFKEALCNYHQSPKSQLDQTKAYEALSQLEQFARVYRESAHIPEVERHIRLVRNKLARKDVENAEYYFKRKRYASALIYLDKVIENYPDNPSWVYAKYLKARVLFAQGEREDEAAALLGEVLSYPEDLPVKIDADLLMKEKGRR